MKTVNVLFQHDNNYAVYGGVAILSLLESNKEAEDICIYLIDMGLEDQYKNDYTLLVEKYGRRIVFLPGHEISKQLETLGIPKYRGSYATYLKLFVLNILPKDVERIFYLDSDLLILNSLEPLCDFDMQGHAIAMSKDAASLAFKDAYGFADEDPYYCGGTILFDVTQWKKQQCLERIVDYAQNVRAAFFAADQDLLNRVLKNEIATLDLKYDFTYYHTLYSDDLFLRKYKKMNYYTKKEIQKARENVVVLHFMRFLGEDPWHKDTLHPHTEQFDYYLAMSPWKDYEKKPSGKGGVFIIEKMMYKYLPRWLFFYIFMAYYRYYVIKADRKLQSARGGNIGF